MTLKPDLSPVDLATAQVSEGMLPSADAIAAATCASRCAIQSTHDAGVGEHGWRWLVVVTQTMPHDNPGRAPSDECPPREVWLLGSRWGQVVSSRLLVSRCPDADSVDDGDPFELEVAPGRLSYVARGGALARWMQRTTLQLPSLRLSETEEATALGRTVTFERFDWNRFTGSGESCESDARTGDAITLLGPPADDLAARPRCETKWTAIPSVKLPSRYIAEDWRWTSLGRCAARLESSDAERGTSSSAPSGSMAAVASGDELFVELRDGGVVERGATPATLDIWFVRETTCVPLPGMPCSEGEVDPSLHRIQVALRDGASAIDERGASVSGVERTPWSMEGGANITRLRIRLGAVDRLTLRYQPSGRRPGNTLTTSNFRGPNARQLGHVFPIDPARAECVRDRSTLSPRIQRAQEGEDAVIRNDLP